MYLVFVIFAAFCCLVSSHGCIDYKLEADAKSPPMLPDVLLTKYSYVAPTIYIQRQYSCCTFFEGIL